MQIMFKKNVLSEHTSLAVVRGSPQTGARAFRLPRQRRQPGLPPLQPRISPCPGLTLFSFPKTLSTVSGFTLDSSFDEVISVMGTPDVINTDYYKFNVSYGKNGINLDSNDRVESWTNKGNLKLR